MLKAQRSTQPAERQRGLMFFEDFASNSSVIENGGNPTGDCVKNKHFYSNDVNKIIYNGVKMQNGATNFTIIIDDVIAPTNVTTESALLSMYNGTKGPLIGFGADVIYIEADGYHYGWYKAVTANQVIGQLAVVYDGAGATGADKLKFYYNGVLQAGTSGNVIPSSITAFDNLALGCWADGTHALRTGASFGKVRVFNRSLSLAEIDDYRNNSTFNYEKKANVNLPMTMDTFDNSTLTEVVVDGNMEAATTASWYQLNASTLSKETTTPHSGTRCLRVTNTDIFGGAYQNFLTIGKTYKLSGWARTDGAERCAVRFYSGSEWLGTANTTNWEYFEITAVATAVNFGLYKYNGTAGTHYVEFDDVQCIEITPKAKDISGNGNDGTLIGGLVKKSTIGYTRTNTTDSLQMTLTNPLTATQSQDQTLVWFGVVKTNNYTPLVGNSNFVIGRTNTGVAYLRSFNPAKAYSNNSSTLTISLNQPVVLIGTKRAGIVNCFINGVKDAVAVDDSAYQRAITKAQVLIPTDVFLDIADVGTASNADPLGFAMYPFALTEIQVKDITNKLLSRVNQI